LTREIAGYDKEGLLHWEFPMKRARTGITNCTLILIISCVAVARLAGQNRASNDAGWPNYGNDPGGTRFSSAKQINRSNVLRLKVA
jgi:hypothetical protein